MKKPMFGLQTLSEHHAQACRPFKQNITAMSSPCMASLCPEQAGICHGYGFSSRTTGHWVTPNNLFRTGTVALLHLIFRACSDFVLLCIYYNQFATSISITM